MIRVGIIGAAGYTAGELIRLLVHHPQVQIVFAQSSSQAGLPVGEVHEGLTGETDLCFSAEADLTSVDVLFLCAGHGKSTEFWKTHTRPEGLRVIDLAQDYRDEHDGYAYGLPEYQRNKIANATLIANPGCFATAIQLALLPLVAAGKMKGEAHVTAITGSTGAGQQPSATTHFSWRTDNLSVYKPFTHQHLMEIQRNLQIPVTFVPIRGDFARGILAAVVVAWEGTQEEAETLYKDYYREAAFTYVSEKPVDLKQVVNTNKCLIHVDVHESRMLITSVIDNLLKGASGQAVQNMNLMFGLPETTGLQLKASAF